MDSHTFNVVIARYNEDVGWINRLPPRIQLWVYDKGGREHKHPFIPNVAFTLLWSSAPNVGREAHTYLRHIVLYYDDLNPDDVTVFCQGRIADHDGCREDGLFVSGLADEARHNGISESRFRTHLSDVEAHHQPVESFRIREWPAGTLLAPNRDDLAFGSWFREFVSPVLPPIDAFRWAVGAVFAVRHDRILRRPKASYERLLACVSSDRNPEAAHFLERSWLYIMTKP